MNSAARWAADSAAWSVPHDILEGRCAGPSCSPGMFATTRGLQHRRRSILTITLPVERCGQFPET